MSPRVLVVVLPGQEPDVLRALPALIAIARAELASIRLACFRPLPAARIDHGSGGTFLSDGHMARVSRAIIGTLQDALRRYDDVAPEVVVRFGSPRREIVTEAEAYEPAFVALFANSGTHPLARLRRWAIRRRLNRMAPARVLVLETPSRPRVRSRRVREAVAIAE